MSGPKAAVAAIFPSFTERFEGLVRSMYTDVKGLVTIAEGNLIDPQPLALDLPFVWPDGTPATRADIAAQWQAVKNDPKGPKLGWRYTATLTKIRLTDEGVARVVSRKLNSNHAQLRSRFGEDFDTWPQDAVLATHSMSWACGAAFRFPKLEAALRAQDFDTASRECHMNEAGNPGLIPRNAANVILYQNAAKVLAYKLDPDALYYPADLTKTAPAATSSDCAPDTDEGSRIIHPAIDLVGPAQARD